MEGRCQNVSLSGLFETKLSKALNLHLSRSAVSQSVNTLDYFCEPLCRTPSISGCPTRGLLVRTDSIISFFHLYSAVEDDIKRRNVNNKYFIFDSVSDAEILATGERETRHHSLSLSVCEHRFV